MDKKEKLLTEIKKVTGINNFENLSSEDGGKILKLIGNNKLSTEHLKVLIEFVPSYVHASAQALQAISNIATHAGASQKEIAESVHTSTKGIINILNTLADSAETDEARLKIAEVSMEAGKLYLEFANISKDINKDNNSTWVKITGVVAGIVLIVGGAVAVIMSGGESNDS